ncbi:hypothetical protein SAMN05216581_3880 [Pseudomonas asplenii]|uniref:Uncharacterized protein n=1 Tax=Pseudomonas asplenii TaxID=53407 RepID=A0A1H6NS12_9PSED|nr:hypothetical protein [Pseudomonas fuscovaginae]SEI19138.1 hypothetical protein SAMN05216581_3880 [Pseudomonas fuscovaginae]
MDHREQSEAHEERLQQAIADQLGITAEELDEWVVSEDGEYTDDDVLVVQSVEFHKNTPSRILARVGLPQEGTKVKHLKPIRADSFDVVAPGPQGAEGIARLRDSSVSAHKPPVFPKMMKWLFICLAVAVGAAAATVAWILHSLGPMPSFG